MRDKCYNIAHGPAVAYVEDLQSHDNDTQGKMNCAIYLHGYREKLSQTSATLHSALCVHVCHCIHCQVPGQ